MFKTQPVVVGFWGFKVYLSQNCFRGVRGLLEAPKLASSGILRKRVKPKKPPSMFPKQASSFMLSIHEFLDFAQTRPLPKP